MELFVLIGWLVLCFAIGTYSSNKGRSFWGIFFLSLFLSPLVGLIVAVVMEPDQEEIAMVKGMKRCPECAQFVEGAAKTCPFCKKDFTARVLPQASQFSPEALSRKCPRCAETIKMEALMCRFCHHEFQPAEVQAAIQQARAEFGAKAGDGYEGPSFRLID